MLLNRWIELKRESSWKKLEKREHYGMEWIQVEVFSPNNKSYVYRDVEQSAWDRVEWRRVVTSN